MSDKTATFMTKYLEQHKRTYITADFAFTSYNPPNTTHRVSDDLNEILLTLPGPTIKVWLRTVSLLVRNSDPVLAVSVLLPFELFEDLCSRSSFFRALKELKANDLLVKVPGVQSLYLVSPAYTHKLYKPKLDI